MSISVSNALRMPLSLPCSLKKLLLPLFSRLPPFISPPPTFLPEVVFSHKFHRPQRSVNRPFPTFNTDPPLDESCHPRPPLTTLMFATPCSLAPGVIFDDVVAAGVRDFGDFTHRVLGRQYASARAIDNCSLKRCSLWSVPIANNEKDGNFVCRSGVKWVGNRSACQLARNRSRVRRRFSLWFGR